MSNYLDFAGRFVPLLATTAAVLLILFGFNRILRRRWKDDPDAQFRFQLIMLAVTFAGLLAVVVALPVTDAVRGQLLSLIGILLSAAIALSSTTFIGNIMAGIMLKAVGNARPGDFITVADLTGRITEMDLLHTEIQTEFRDLVTVPNLYMVTQPLRVVRASGSIITAEVSLGYDVSHARVAEILSSAVARAGLEDGFVHVRELGDFSVTYRVAGLLKDIQSLISARSTLRTAVLDTLHEAGIEIVSPAFMSTRALKEGSSFIPARSQNRSVAQPTAEEVAFDKADEAATVEHIRTAIKEIESQLTAAGSDEGALDPRKKLVLEEQKLRLTEQLSVAEQHMKAQALDD